MNDITPPRLRKNREEACQKIEAQIEKGQQFRDQLIDSKDGLQEAIAECRKWSRYNTVFLSQLFNNTSIVDDHYTCVDYLYTTVTTYSTRFSDQLDRYHTFMNSSINSLEEICNYLELYDDPSETSQPTFGSDVFVVHGRDEAAKHAIARFVEKLGLKPIILDEQPDAGLTIIEKLEREARNVGFAVALLTPDDVGALKDEADDQLKPRARQNVILELGYFMGKLGRKKVCLLIKGELENPSDLDGILYASMNNPNEWQLKLAKEMKQAGLPVDSEKLL